MRLFVGLEIPEEVRAKLSELLDRLRPAARLRWSPVANLHITTKFIGEWPKERLSEMKTALDQVTGEPVPIAIRGLGWFPNPHQPRVFFASVRAPATLVALAAQTAEAVAALGVLKETRDYSPHMTLARIPAPSSIIELRRRVAALPSDDFGSFTATEFHLYRSQPVPGGSAYSKLATFPIE
ncbi:MAG: RNA 2',3'-cyclic phosphodiesterase [Candidatus Solibacter usitatus]|nr:RNA 2',3'-cyclic phosphodiesterase [Candidatus Solibacter usitatus]